MIVKIGRQEGIPYSLSRWTDVPAAKWEWMMDAFKQQKMVAFDPRTAIPSEWSLKPEDTLGLLFWTKDPTNLITEADLIKRYRHKIHVTLTGWEEVERGAPNLAYGTALLVDTVEAFGPANVTWRFSPVPLLHPDEIAVRFQHIAYRAGLAGLRSVYLSFLQANDLMPEMRTLEERHQLLRRLADVGAPYGIQIRLCNEDRLLVGASTYPNLDSDVCAPPKDFALPNREAPPSEGCGCVLMADPFTVNETCTMGCQYCYAADENLSPKKRNTTRSLPVIR
jgi:hypothetical protein